MANMIVSIDIILAFPKARLVIVDGFLQYNGLEIFQLSQWDKQRYEINLPRTYYL